MDNKSKKVFSKPTHDSEILDEAKLYFGKETVRTYF